MKRSITSVLLACCGLVGLFGLVGCKPKATTPEPAVPAAMDDTTAMDDTAHTHADGNGHAAHGGHAAGPHGGTVVDWGGGKYHVEFTVDHDQQTGTVYILGPDGKSPVAIDAESIDLSIQDPVMQVTLLAEPQAADPAGQASRFVGQHQSLGVVQEYAGTIVGVIDGTPYSGDFAEHPHDDH